MRGKAKLMGAADIGDRIVFLVEVSIDGGEPEVVRQERPDVDKDWSRPDHRLYDILHCAVVSVVSQNPRRRLPTELESVVGDEANAVNVPVGWEIPFDPIPSA